MTHSHFATVVSLVSILGLAACGESPEALVHAPSNAAPAAAVLFEGDVVLSGELAQAQQGFLFVSARPAGTRMPILTKKHELADFAPLAADGTRSFHYQLTEGDFMGGIVVQLPGALELQVKFDPDGLVETFEGVEEAVFVVEPGKTTYDVELQPGMPKPQGPKSAFETTTDGE